MTSISAITDMRLESSSSAGSRGGSEGTSPLAGSSMGGSNLTMRKTAPRSILKSWGTSLSGKTYKVKIKCKIKQRELDCQAAPSPLLLGTGTFSCTLNERTLKRTDGEETD